MSKVIRSQKIDDGYFSLVVEEVVVNELTGNTELVGQVEEEDREEKNAQHKAQYEDLISQAEEMRGLAEQELLANEEKAREIVATAQRQGKEILLQATQKGYSEGYAKGMEEGRAQAFAEAAEETQRIRREANDMVARAEEIRTKLIRDAEEEVVELTMTIASKVIHSHVEVKRDTVVHLATEALDRAVAAGYYTVFVNPDDVEILKEYISELRRSASGNSRIHIIPDGSVSMGGCKVESEQGMVDVTLESQLEQIRKTLREVLDGNG